MVDVYSFHIIFEPSVFILLLGSQDHRCTYTYMYLLQNGTPTVALSRRKFLQNSGHFCACIAIFNFKLPFQTTEVVFSLLLLSIMRV